MRETVAITPVTLACPDAMAADVDGVLAGEYEAGFDGENLTIVDIGANVGAFSIWANLRWPNSRIHAFEPNPATFAMLTANVGHLGNVTCHQTAVYPGEPGERRLFSRYPGDGEAGLVDYIGNTFAELPEDRLVAVPTIDPSALPRCDVLKIDVEGGEAAILEAMNLTEVSLILLEYQDLRNRSAIETRLRDGFSCVFSDREPWRPILPRSGYRAALAGDAYGHLFYANIHIQRLRRNPDHGAVRPVHPDRLSLRQVLRALPGAALRTLRARLR
jgi:FkbM family methyltransferase